MIKLKLGSNKQLTSVLSLCGYFGALIALFAISNLVFAQSSQSLGDVAGNVTGTMGSVAKLITAASYVAGVGFALMGMLKFKAHKDNPTQVPLSQPIVLLAIAAGLVFLPSLIGSGGQTVWGGSQQGGSTAGGNMQGITN
ncbi:MAG: type IV secretion protein IcmD [Candidatus Berkiellales bacterium]